MSTTKNFTEWNVQLSKEEEQKLIPARLNDKDLLTDFEFLHHDMCARNKNGNTNELAFFNNNCLWVLRYRYNSNCLHLGCDTYSNKGELNQSFQDLIESITECYDSTNIVQNIQYDSNHNSIMVYYYFKSE